MKNKCFITLIMVMSTLTIFAQKTFNGKYHSSETNTSLHLHPEGYGAYVVHVEDAYYVFKYWETSNPNVFKLLYHTDEETELTIMEMGSIGLTVMDSEYNTYNYEHQGPHEINTADLAEIKGYFTNVNTGQVAQNQANQDHPNQGNTYQSGNNHTGYGNSSNVGQSGFDPDTYMYSGTYKMNETGDVIKFAPNGYGTYFEAKKNKTYAIKYWVKNKMKNEYTMLYFGGEESPLIMNHIPGMGIQVMDVTLKSFDLEAMGGHGLSYSELNTISNIMKNPQPLHNRPINGYDQMIGFRLPILQPKTRAVTFNGRYVNSNGDYTDFHPDGVFEGKDGNITVRGLYHVFPDKKYVRFVFPRNKELIGLELFYRMGSNYIELKQDDRYLDPGDFEWPGLSIIGKYTPDNTTKNYKRSTKKSQTKISDQRATQIKYMTTNYFFLGEMLHTDRFYLDGFYRSKKSGATLDFSTYGHIVSISGSEKLEGLYIFTRKGRLVIVNKQGQRFYGSIRPQGQDLFVNNGTTEELYEYLGPSRIQHRPNLPMEKKVSWYIEKQIMAEMAADKQANANIVKNWTSNIKYVNEYGERVW